MKLTAIALASAYAISSTCAFASTVRDNSTVTIHPMYGDTGPSVVTHQNYPKPNGSVGGTGHLDMWGHWGAYYGPMISIGG